VEKKLFPVLSGDITSHCGGGGSGPCPEHWAELVLTTGEESSLFGSAMDKAIGNMQQKLL
jgi:hypothetical protein